MSNSAKNMPSTAPRAGFARYLLQIPRFDAEGLHVPVRRAGMSLPATRLIFGLEDVEAPILNSRLAHTPAD